MIHSLKKILPSLMWSQLPPAARPSPIILPKLMKASAALKKSTFPLYDRFSDHQIPLSESLLNQAAQSAFQKYYKKPMPDRKEITFLDDHKKRWRWASLSPDDRDIVIKNRTQSLGHHLTLPYEGPHKCEPYIPRWTHGVMHATRAALIVKLCAHLYNKYRPDLKITKQEILLAQFLAVYHDSARQAEGPDIWDDESAENMIAPMRRLNFSEDVIQSAVHLLQQKDSTDPDKSIISKLVQSADCLDIMRLYGFDWFENERLDLFNDLKNDPNFLVDFEHFQIQLSLFIQKTEQPIIKLYLEAQSKNCLKDLESLFVAKMHYPCRDLTAKSQAYSSTLQGLWNANPDKKMGIYQVIPTYLGGSHSTYLLQHPSGKLFFFKKTSWETTCEVAGSHLAHYITNGLVPKAEEINLNGERGVLQEYIELSHHCFTPFNPQKLTFDQHAQLFCQMIGDYVIANYDNHPRQFACDDEGRVISFDKGFAFGPLKERDDPSYHSLPKDFDPTYLWPCMKPQISVYKDFSRYLKSNPTYLQSLLKSKRIQKCFMKCILLVAENQYNPMKDSLEGKKIVAKVLQRSHSAPNSIRNYFSKT